MVKRYCHFLREFWNQARRFIIIICHSCINGNEGSILESCHYMRKIPWISHSYCVSLAPATQICKQLGTLSVSLFKNKSEWKLWNLEPFCYLTFSLQEVSTRYRQNPFKFVKSHPCTHIREMKTCNCWNIKQERPCGKKLMQGWNGNLSQIFKSMCSFFW